MRLVVSNRAEELLDALAADVRAVRARAGRGLFDPTYLVVPNRSVETYVKLGIARATGVAANVRAAFLRAFLTDVLEDAYPGTRVLGTQQMMAMLLDLLHDDAALADPELAPVVAYLRAAGERPEAVDLRRYQLAAELAPLYDEYGLSRPEMLAAWAAPEKRSTTATDGGAGAVAVAGWQRRLWLAMVGRGGLIDRREKATKTRWLTLAAALDQARPEDLKVRGPVHVFGISYATGTFHRALGLLAKAADVFVYAPAAPTGGTDVSPPEPATDALVALRAWGRPAHESMRLFLDAIPSVDVVSRVVDPRAEQDTLLRRLQYDVLGVGGAARPGAAPADDSIVFLACPGIRRELEVAAAEIWALVRADESLRFNEIAVILPGPTQDTYLHHTQAVFRAQHDLPHSFIDVPLSGDSRVVDAIDRLLAIPTGGFTRAEILRAMTHPCVMARFPDAIAVDWARLCDGLGIVHGADRADHQGTYIERDLLNWDQGCKRLALGAFMAGDDGGGRGDGGGEDPRPLTVGAEAYLPFEVDADEAASAASLGLLVRSLVTDARFARTARLALSEWLGFLRAFIGAYVIASTDEDQRALLRCLGALQDLEALDARRPMSFRVARELVLAALSSLSAGRGQHLAEGVVVSSAVPMRAVPFKVVFMLGLGEGLFPAADRPGGLDLRAAHRQAGDVTPRDRDRATFLETLLGARDRLYLSYVARDVLTGDPLQPSSVVEELRDALRTRYGGEDDLALRTRRFPLWRHQDALTRASSLPAEREAQAMTLGENWRAAAAAGVGVAAALPSGARMWDAVPELTRILDLCALPEPAPSQRPDRTVVVSLSAIRRFLECPLQGWARILLGLRDADDEDDVVARQDETFSATRIDTMALLRAAFGRAAGDPSAAGGGGLDPARLARAYTELAFVRELQGVLPTGVFGTAERAGHQEVLAAWLQTIALIAGSARSFAGPRAFRFGRADGGHGADETWLEPVILDVAVPAGEGSGVDGVGGVTRLRVEVVGRTQPIIEAPRGSLILTGRRPKGADRVQKLGLRGFLDHVILAASGALAPGTHEIIVCFADDPDRPARILLGPVSRDDARGYLVAVLRDLWSGAHAHFFPWEAVWKVHNKSDKSLIEIADDLRFDRWNRHSSHYGPVPGAEDYPVPPQAEAAAIVARRFAPYFALQISQAPDRGRAQGPRR